MNQLNLDTWTQGLLGELIVVERGSSPRPIVNYVTNSDDGVNWVKIGDTKEGQKYVKKTKEKITKEGALKSRYVAKGDFILSNSMSFGRPYIMDIEGYIHDGWFALRLPEQINKDFFYYLLSSTYIKDQINLLAVGGVVKNISGDLVKKVSLPLPPLAEQKVIADKLDTLLAQVETTKTRLDRIPKILKTFRQSVLSAAVSGKLTEEWRVDNECSTPHNYRQICDQERKEYFDKKTKKLVDIEKVPDIKLPDNWVWQSLDASSLRITDGTHFSPKSTSIGDFMYITSKNVRAGYIDLSKISYIDEVTHREIYQRCDVKKGDVLYVKDGANTGLACVNSIEEEFSLLSSVGVFKVCSFVNPSYLEHYLNSPTGRELMLGMMGGTAIPRLTLTKLAKAPFSLPPFEEQTQIVRRVEELFAFADRIEQKSNAALDRVNNLTQSILAKAFRGELTAQWRKDNPELISGDNSAEALLAKIQSAKEALKPIKKGKKEIELKR